MTTTFSNGLGKMFVVFVAAVIVLGIAFLGLSNTGKGTVSVPQSAPDVRAGLSESEAATSGVDYNQNEWNDLMNGTVSSFDLDVYIPSSHAAIQHGAQEMNDALRTCTQYGTVAIISTNYSRRLTLLCEDPNTGRQFAVIIEKIKRSIDSFKNSYSELVTAFELKAEGQWLDTNIAAYINNEVNIAKTGILVRLAFKAGELFFSPYR